MTDVVNSDTRSQMMAGIRGTNTKPEVLIRSLLHRSGFRFRIHVRRLPGKPDIVFSRLNAVIFIHGCFWHGHECRYFKWPETRPEFWRAKIEYNQKNDAAVLERLRQDGWRIAILWECGIRSMKKNPEVPLAKLIKWLRSNQPFLEITG